MPKTRVFVFISQEKYFQGRDANSEIENPISFQNVMWPKSQIPRNRIGSGLELVVPNQKFHSCASQPNLMNYLNKISTTNSSNYDLYAKAFATDQNTTQEALEEQQFQFRRDFVKTKSTLYPYLNTVINSKEKDKFSQREGA